MCAASLNKRWIERFEVKDVMVECFDDKDRSTDAYNTVYYGKVRDLSLCGGQFYFHKNEGFPQSGALWLLNLIVPQIESDICARGYVRWIKHDTKTSNNKVGMFFHPRGMQDTKLLQLLQRRSALNYE